MQFLGNIEARIDAKSRVFIPATFRRILLSESEPTLILRKDIYQDCIVLSPKSVWEEESTRLRSRLSKWNREKRELLREYRREAEETEMDSSGRILIPKWLLQSCGIETDVRFLGMDDVIEIWPKAALEKPRVDPEVFRQQIAAIMDDDSEADE